MTATTPSMKTTFIRRLLFCLLAMAFSPPHSIAQAANGGKHDPNQYILAALKTMPAGGGYDATQAAVDRLAASVNVVDGTIRQDLTVANASFCSGATYLVFLRAVELMRKQGDLKLSRQAVALLADLGVKDGERVFGRWNANGPGTARLFAELGCGKNFTSYDQAQPGDFMKIWWNDEIGVKERGHLVIYLGRDGGKIRFWSSNQPDGYGTRTIERKTIQRVLFSRLERPERLENVVRLPQKDVFLAEMLEKRSTWERVAAECAVR